MAGHAAQKMARRRRRSLALAAVAVTLLAPAVLAFPQGHKVAKDEEYGYSRQYMYGRRDHGAIHAGSSPWQQHHGVKHGFYGMYDHYMIGRVHPLGEDESPHTAEVKGHRIGAASQSSPANHGPVIVLAVLSLLNTI